MVNWVRTIRQKPAAHLLKLTNYVLILLPYHLLLAVVVILCYWMTQEKFIPVDGTIGVSLATNKTKLQPFTSLIPSPIITLIRLRVVGILALLYLLKVVY